jgi:2-polyprenyl-6-methoxyphenol hydroxylase-like FAD-dependent oxidoreductase
MHVYILRGAMTQNASTLPVAVIGAGPVGLAAAAHLASRGLEFVVLEAATPSAPPGRVWCCSA